MCKPEISQYNIIVDIYKYEGFHSQLLKVT